MQTRILKDMCRVLGHEYIYPQCSRCGRIEVYGVRFWKPDGALISPKQGEDMIRPGQGFRVQYRTLIFDHPVANGHQIDVIIGQAGTPWGVQTFVGDGKRRGFKLKL